MRDWARELMDGFGVAVRTGVTVDRFDEGGVTLTDGTRKAPAAVIWGAGVTPGEAVADWESPRTKSGRLKVDEHLRAAGRERVFVAGDLGGPTAGGGGEPLRMGVQFSLMAGRQAAINVLRALHGEPLERFDPRDLGYIVPLAPGAGAGDILGWALHGRVPQMLHYLMCSFRSWGWANRLGVLRCATGRRKVGPPPLKTR